MDATKCDAFPPAREGHGFEAKCLRQSRRNRLAAAAEGCDFEGLEPHFFRRANITWRQEVGGSSIEASKIAGHANTRITEEYTIVQMRRQEELTRRIQDKRAKAATRSQGLQVVKKEAAA